MLLFSASLCRLFVSSYGVPVQLREAIHSAVVPATCEEAMLVPEIVLQVPLLRLRSPFYVDLMHTPGATMV